MCLGQIAWLAIHVYAIDHDVIIMVGQFVDHLTTCARMQPDHWRVLLLESRLQMVLREHVSALVSAGMDKLPESIRTLKVLDYPIVEQKLRRVLEQQPKSLEAYIVLTQCLDKQVSA